jgi:hypothetical protein
MSCNMQWDIPAAPDKHQKHSTLSSWSGLMIQVLAIISDPKVVLILTHHLVPFLYQHRVSKFSVNNDKNIEPQDIDTGRLKSHATIPAYMVCLSKLNYTKIRNSRPWWSRLPWDPMLQVQTQPRTMNFYGWQKSIACASFGGEVKPLVPCHRFMACKRTLRSMTSKFPTPVSYAWFSCFATRWLWWTIRMIRNWHGCLSLVFLYCVALCVTNWSLIQQVLLYVVKTDYETILTETRAHIRL